MFFVSWMYVLMTMFEPMDLDEEHMARWDSQFSWLFAIEFIILLLYMLDLSMSVYHNFYERRFKEFRFVPKSEREKVMGHVWEGMSPKKGDINKAFERQVSIRTKKLERKFSLDHEADDVVIQKHPHHFNKGRILFMTLLCESDIKYKILIFGAFIVDFMQFYIRYPKNFYRYSWLLRTGN